MYACTFVCALCACLAPMEVRSTHGRGGGSLVTVVTDGGKLTCGPWEPSLAPVEEQQMFFPAEPPL